MYFHDIMRDSNPTPTLGSMGSDLGAVWPARLLLTFDGFQKEEKWDEKGTSCSRQVEQAAICHIRMLSETYHPVRRRVHQLRISQT